MECTHETTYKRIRVARGGTKQEKPSLGTRIKRHPVTIGVSLFIPVLCYYAIYWMWKFRVWSTKTRTIVSGIHARVAKLLKKRAELRLKRLAPKFEYMEGCGPKPTLSAWDGELPGAERLMRRTAHDPDSIDVENCTVPQMSDKHCWVTKCQVRGTNAFGAKILNQKVFTWKEGTVGTLQ